MCSQLLFYVNSSATGAIYFLLLVHIIITLASTDMHDFFCIIKRDREDVHVP